MDLLIGLDIGTSAIKGVAVTVNGEQLASGRRTVPFEYPRPGHVEVSAQKHYLLLCDLIRELAAQAGTNRRIKALGMAVASGNSILLDADKRPLTRIISWLDQRAVDETETILPTLDTEQVHEITGWPWIEMFPLAQLAWLKHYLSDVYTSARYRKMNLEYLLYRLCGRWVLDCSNATTSYLHDQRSRTWYEPYLDMLEIPRQSMSELLPAGTSLGPLRPESRQQTGLDASTELVLGAFDHPCAARATGTLKPGQFLLSCGTSWAAFYPLKRRDPAVQQGMLVDPFLEPGGPWAGIGALRSIGVNIDWTIDNLIVPFGSENRYQLFNGAAAAAPAGAGGLYLNPLKELSRDPERVGQIRGSFAREQIARAVMEGAAFETRRLIERYAAAGIPTAQMAMVGGPSESPIWPQIVADITGLELTLVNGQNAGAVGAAALAGIGSGCYRNEVEAFEAFGGRKRIITPEPRRADAYSKLYQEYLQART